MPECHCGGDCPEWYKCSTFSDKSDCPHTREFKKLQNAERYKAWIVADFDAFCHSQDTLLSRQQQKIAHTILHQLGMQFFGAVLKTILEYVLWREPFETVFAECPQCSKEVIFPRNTEAEFLCSSCGAWVNKPKEKK